MSIDKPDCEALNPAVLPSGNPPTRTIDRDGFRLWDDGYRVYARPLPPVINPATVLVVEHKHCDYPGAASAAMDAVFALVGDNGNKKDRKNRKPVKRPGLEQGIPQAFAEEDWDQQHEAETDAT